MLFFSIYSIFSIHWIHFYTRQLTKFNIIHKIAGEISIYWPRGVTYWHMTENLVIRMLLLIATFQYRSCEDLPNNIDYIKYAYILLQVYSLQKKLQSKFLLSSYHIILQLSYNKNINNRKQNFLLIGTYCINTYTVFEYLRKAEFCK